jgi:hypothetical protein
MAEDMHLETKTDEGKFWPRDMPLYVGRRRDGVTPCNVKE